MAGRPDDADKLALASFWRFGKLRDFEQRLVSAGLSNTAVGSELLQRLQAETCAVQALQERHTQQGDLTPWWADGEYNDAEADRANDMGTQLFRSKQYSAAFSYYTEAIRLCPQKSTYHCNRAASALQLRQYIIAAADARHAIKRDPQNVKAFIRAGGAQMELQHLEEAMKMYRQALQLDKTNAAAQRGLEAATRAQALAAAEALKDQADAGRGDRGGVSRQPVEAEQAAQLLNSAEGMLRAQPSSHAVKCSYAEALLACQRYPDAMHSMEGLRGGVDKAYLQAEALWRQGDLSTANAVLSDACQQFISSSKCADLQLWVNSLQQRIHTAETACEDGLLGSSISLYDEVIADLQPEVCSGLYAHLLQRKADVQRQLGHFDAALQGLDCAIRWEPSNVECLQLRAKVHREAGNFTQSFMDLQRVAKMMPDSAEMFQQLQQAASLCLGSPELGLKGQGHSVSSTYYETLGLSTSASSADVRHAYRQLAAQWHPDKWVRSSKAGQDAAAQRFAEIASAYAALTGPR